MELQALTFAALGLGLGALVLASLAYWRTGSASDGVVLAERIRRGHQRTMRRAQRGKKQLAALDSEVTPSLRAMFEVIGWQLDEIEREANDALSRLRRTADLRMQLSEETLARKMRRLEGRIELLSARTEMTHAERLAQRQRFLEAENLLEDAVAKVRAVQARAADDLEEPSFDDILDSLQTALQSVRAQANDHKARIDRVVSASDVLLAALEAGERRRTSVWPSTSRTSFH